MPHVSMDNHDPMTAAEAAAGTMDVPEDLTLGTADAAVLSDPTNTPPRPSQPTVVEPAAEDNADEAGSDESIYGDQDDAQSFMQPSISPAATRLSSSRTPAAEKAQAMEEGDGYFGRPSAGLLSPGSGPSGANKPLTARSSMLQTVARHNRSSSVGTDALKRLSKALPSFSFPNASNILPNLNTPSFLSSLSSQNQNESPKPSPTQTQTQTQTQLQPKPQRPAAPRRTTSEDSVLYHSLSRVSSLGDDYNFDHVREQVNSRVKAIKDSFDVPTFRLPSTSRAPSPPSPLDSVLADLEGDVVILGGYRGSILRSSTPPHRQLWVPVKVGLNIRRVNMAVGLNDVDELEMEKTMFASGMLQHIGPVDISRRLFRRIRESPNARAGRLRVHDYGYDWRLSPHLLSSRLISFLEKLPCNQEGPEPKGAIVIAHSLGGLITRHAVNSRPDLFSGVIYAGTPQRCVNILGPLRNGDAVLINEKVLTAQVNFSLRTTFAFLPEDGYCFVNARNPQEEYRVDFYNVDDWIRYRLSPCVGPAALPATNAPLIRRSTITSLIEDFREKTEKTEETERAEREELETNKAYLERTMQRTRRFRAELAHRPELTAANAYPPLATIYGKGIPTVYAARVDSREAIAHADAFDRLLFKSGDGVVLTREALLPPGYDVVRDGHVSSDRGHVSLLGDLTAVGRALEAVVRGRQKGIGLGETALTRTDTVVESRPPPDATDITPTNTATATAIADVATAVTLPNESSLSA